MQCQDNQSWHLLLQKQASWLHQNPSCTHPNVFGLVAAVSLPETGETGPQYDAALEESYGFRKMRVLCSCALLSDAGGLIGRLGGIRRNPGLSDFHFLLRCARTSGVRMRAAPPEMEAKPMDIKNVLEVLQALALVASITKTFLAIAKEVEEMIREHKHHNG
jgi:hypothetical protein